MNSEVVVPGNGIETNANAKEKRKAVTKNGKVVKVIFFVLLALLSLEVLFYKVIMPGLGASRISFDGSLSHTDEELMQMLAPLANTSWFMFDARKAEQLIAESPAIAYANAKKYFPNNVFISITEREPVAMTFLNYGGRSVPVEIDKNGILFEQRYASSEPVPIVSGIPLENMSSGMRIPSKYKALIEQISQIRMLPQQYFAAVSEICVMPKENGSYELMLIPAFSRTKVLTDRTLTEDALQYMMVVLDVVNSIEPDVSEVDLRYGAVSYRKRR